MAAVRGKENVNRILVEKRRGMSLFGRPRYAREGNITCLKDRRLEDLELVTMLEALLLSMEC